ncbi:protein-tyrosine phosphatase family protein [Saccharothrix syringae]|uniref:Protein tyrosine phosphatase n=1 Tax=Saccharothrix syringae TaxID=103733 RepID=A0A5Q0HA82_SACSY|nr:protein-tyrosine phosphatase family protein [Saccharothrix syringae]QFZ22864.1 protein tyrosine phosphatase [Saccharothrix syringae]
MKLTGAIELPDGAVVRGRGLRYPAPEGTPDYGLYLGSERMRRAHSFAWPHEWVEWPDFRLPRDSERAVEMIRDLHARASAGERVEVACGGGIGRTGTVVACLAVLAGVPSTEAVAWTRAHYHRRAVETPWQKKWVVRFPG